MHDEIKNYSDQKRRWKKNDTSNNKLITFLPMMWKILTVQIRDKIT